uniref:Uncharacterized protein n=1 Tax=Salmonella derby TaxID=28144 RepID=A0A1S7BGE7_SALDE|nr:hypothetical protein [Salmonella enterica subsp. enterica serovar Derby]
MCRWRANLATRSRHPSGRGGNNGVIRWRSRIIITLAQRVRANSG